MSASEADCGVCGYAGCLLVAVLFFVWGLACMLVSEVDPEVCGCSGCPGVCGDSGCLGTSLHAGL